MRAKQNAVSRRPYPWSVGKKKDAQKASLSTKLKKRDTSVFVRQRFDKVVVRLSKNLS